MPSPLVVCASEASFSACVPDPASRRIVVGVGPAFVFVTADEEIVSGSALHRAIVENGWLARGFIGVDTDGMIAVLHDRTVPDVTTMNAAVVHLTKIAEDRDATVVQWLDRLHSLPDTRESEVALA